MERYLYVLPGVILAITLHEFAHGFVSYLLGDPTPKREGRLSLNPLKHLDPIGAICMVLFHVGFAKPVQINPYYYKRPRSGIALVSLAGPLMNLITGVLGIFTVNLVSVLIYFGHISQGKVLDTVLTLIYYFAVLSINLCIFNLIPLPPLDGSKIIGFFLPDRVNDWFNRNHNVCMLILMAIIYFGLLDGILDKAFNFIFDLIENGTVSILVRFFL